MAHDLFGPVIYSYTDEQAREDGVLVAVSRKDRVTQAFWAWLTEEVQTWDSPPVRWPIELFGFCRAKTADDKALATVAGLLDTFRREATRIYEQNIGGGIWERYYEPQARMLLDKKPGLDHKTLWLIPNELGGVTLLFPEDY